MRQSQHGKKPRGRGRKQHNPLSRVYDSNGPDVKIRGTAAHVADKYMNLARDAQSSGDHVAAENYLQHAEHYLRIIAAAQAQMQPPAPAHNEQPAVPYPSDNNASRETADESNGQGGDRPSADRRDGEETEQRPPRRRRRPNMRAENPDGSNGGNRRNGQNRQNPSADETPAAAPEDPGQNGVSNEFAASEAPTDAIEPAGTESSEKPQPEAGA